MSNTIEQATVEQEASNVEFIFENDHQIGGHVGS